MEQSKTIRKELIKVDTTKPWFIKRGLKKTKLTHDYRRGGTFMGERIKDKRSIKVRSSLKHTISLTETNSDDAVEVNLNRRIPIP
jgi:hypothetical protein